ncbi:MAG: carboxymuconolactone decarboxylase family protein [Gemmatimonadaceae bacterium]|jgi:4-carboxymuconolactone decarboxylase|nr:carboxymuconolactone decarboxylase family protein [Gemmatimonadaceae bacterium]
MSQHPRPAVILPTLDDATRQLVLVAAAIAGGSEAASRAALAAAHAAGVPAAWVEEVVLQSYLFAGFPRALNAMREWRRISGAPAPADDPRSALAMAPQWAADGERTCAVVYGDFYTRLRHNIGELHPALDAWMIVDGYGKVLSREGLDLARRELCVVAACAAQEQDRQLHSHLHGAVNAGVALEVVGDVLALLEDRLSADAAQRYRLLWRRVRQGFVA